MTLRLARPWMFALFLVLPLAARAQAPADTPPAQTPQSQTPTPAPQTQTPAQAPQAPAANTPQPAAEQQLLKPAELDGLVAPIALYPDTLLAQMLMASTYPLEVIQADRWVRDNKQLKGDQLKTEAEKQAWDESVKSLVATPSVLAMMSDKLDWTQKLGDAVLAQQPDVMDAIQRMRARAYDNKKLTTTKQQVVTVSQQQNQRTIAIEPAVAGSIYVPYYEPSVVYGAWPYADYPAYPYYWGAPGYVAAGVLATGIAFGTAYALGRWATGGNFWRGGIAWGGGRGAIIAGNRVNWQHNSLHRGGVRYNNASVRQQFGNNNIRAGRDNRMDFRGRGGQQVLRPSGGDRANLADRANRGDRAANRADRTANRADRGGAGRAGAADRARGGGQRADAARGARGGGAAANRGGRGGAFGNMQSGRGAMMASQRGRASFAQAGLGRGGGFARAGGGGFHGGGFGGGGFRGGGGGGGGFRGGGGRRSDIGLKHHIVLLGHLDQGLGFYRFAYNGSSKPYVGVMAQEVQAVMPEAVTRGRDGYLRVFYDRLGVRFQTYEHWIASGARVPTIHIQQPSM
jgi:Protein of unknown function (DUF3300)